MPRILKEPDARLHQVSTEVIDFAEARNIARELIIVARSATKWWNRCLGFAANQIGYPRRIVVLRQGARKYKVLVNPKILEKRFPFPNIETCYSLPKKDYYLVTRYLWTRISYQDTEGRQHEEVIRGPSALYQEIDHLNGVMIRGIGIRIF